jgi:two-component system response regulator FixJ
MLMLMSKTQALVAVLDDEPKFCQALARLLKSHGFDVVTFTQGGDFFSAFASRRPDCLLLDLHMPGSSGFEVLERLAVQNVPLPVIVLTGHDQPGNDARVRELGGVDYLLKPLNESQLLSAIGKAI